MIFIYLGHHFSQLPNCDFIVRVAHIEYMTVSPGWIFLREKNPSLNNSFWKTM